MSGDNTGCPAEIQSCDYSFPSIYHGTTVGDYIQARLDELACEANQGSTCGVFDICTAEGEILTLIGNRLGWPREHCNVRPIEFSGNENATPPNQGAGPQNSPVAGTSGLDGSQNFVFSDDEQYRSFLKAAAIKQRQRRSKQQYKVKSINEVIKSLWGDDAWIVQADDGVIGVSAGRDLTQQEIEILSLYDRIICVGAGIRLEVYSIAPQRPGPC